MSALLEHAVITVTTSLHLARWMPAESPFKVTGSTDGFGLSCRASAWKLSASSGSAEESSLIPLVHGGVDSTSARAKGGSLESSAVSEPMVGTAECQNQLRNYRDRTMVTPTLCLKSHKMCQPLPRFPSHMQFVVALHDIRTDQRSTDQHPLWRQRLLLTGQSILTPSQQLHVMQHCALSTITSAVQLADLVIRP